MGEDGEISGIEDASHSTTHGRKHQCGQQTGDMREMSTTEDNEVGENSIVLSQHLNPRSQGNTNTEMATWLWKLDTERGAMLQYLEPLQREFGDLWTLVSAAA